MVLVKLLGAIDMLAALLFLMQAFGIDPYVRILLFVGGLLLVKGLFIFTGEIVLSAIDLFAALFLLVSIFFTLPIIIPWACAFLLIAKGVVSFI